MHAGELNQSAFTAGEVKRFMKTFMEAAAMFGRPQYEESNEEGYLWDTVVWALGLLNHNA